MNIEETKNWIKKAENDLKVVKYLIEGKDPITDVICFHAQQCVEKYLKAFLVYNNKSFHKTHNIAEILRLCIEIDTEFEELAKIDVHELTVYATELRYPEFFYIPSIDEAKKCLELALKVQEFVVKKLNIK
ncbi:MAG: HEPN domain-containing protein [Bacteroidales bacterium]|jgi:HEPN domain-containing protein|nr:HEPN domain-containing protein [Bacteroidales bacterium]MDI9575677.1 HEPN domain-containing protein [Bacteroidota bacterium]MDD2592787.1 HEPN domain-containing protein [Bacteroidales bacterium]MDD3755153.1 HEPN domain-containing protein [Bacteroidales bacterium]MDY0400251.1 HEPN domain-containing protein [Bacteroidales bacterium]